MDDTIGPSSSYLPNLGTLIADRGLKQSAVAWDIPCDPALVSDWVRGKRRVPRGVLPKLAQQLGLSVTDLLIQGSDGWTPPEPRARLAAPVPLEQQVEAIQAEAAAQLVAEPPEAREPLQPPRPLPLKLGTIDATPLGYRPPVLCHAGPSCPCRTRRKENA